MATSYMSTTDTTAPTASTFSVADNAVDTSIVATLDDVVAFAEMADQTGYAVLDVRSAEEYAGTNFASNVFQGHVTGATHSEWSGWFNDDSTFMTKTEIEAILAAPTAGDAILSTDTIYAHCQTATRSGTTMFALEVILGYENAKNWDGSWAEWGNMVTAIDGSATLDASKSTNVYLSVAEEALWDTFGNTTNATMNTGTVNKIFIAEGTPTLTADLFIVEDTAYTTHTSDDL
jgi:rhodanese-related sulfurtransferase